ncbi:MAG: hypothetical protein MRY83_04035, partial [Flavobacteriales bacterium]|nr:hypothetical protein [Flavobacteriales bacterium]
MTFKNLKYTSVAVFFVCLHYGGFAQDDTLQSEDIYVVKGYKPEISEAKKINEAPSAANISAKELDIEYRFLKKQIKSHFETEPIRAAKVKGEKLNRLYHSYVKLGLGSNLTTLGDLHIAETRSRKQAIGLYISHLGSPNQIKNYGPSGFSDNSAKVYGKKFLRNQVIRGSIQGEYNTLKHFGYLTETFPNVEKDSIKQNFTKIGFSVGNKSFLKDSTKFNRDINLTYYNLRDRYKSQENNFKIDADLYRNFGKEVFHVKGALDVNTFKNETNGSHTNGILSVNPYIVSKGKKWRLNAGLGIFADIDEPSKFYFKPISELKFNVVSNIIIPYVGVTGDVKRTSFDRLRQTNPFIMSDLNLINENHVLEVYGGIRGSLNSKMSFNTKYMQKKVQNMALFVVDSSFLNNTFNVVYDTVKIQEFFGELIYNDGDKMTIGAQGSYFIYDQSSQEEAWHLPNFRLSILGKYNIQDKLYFKGNITYN